MGLKGEVDGYSVRPVEGATIYIFTLNLALMQRYFPRLRFKVVVLIIF